MRAIGIATVVALVCLSTSSFMPPPPAEPLKIPGPAMDGRPRRQPYFVPTEDPRWAAWIAWGADDTGMPIWMAARMFSQEQTGNVLIRHWPADPRKIVSKAGAVGRAQFMPADLPVYSKLFNDGVPIDPYDDQTAFRVAMRIVADRHITTGSWVTALRSYNGGLGHWINPRLYGDWWPESIEYAKAIMGDQR